MSKKEKKGKAYSVSVAILDDDERIADMISRYILGLGCFCVVYTNAEEFILDLENKSFDIVITDLNMPCIDGITILKKVKKKNLSTDVVIVTGNASKQAAIQALKLGAFDFFEKPINGTELIETIKRTVRYRAAIRERDHFADQLSFLSQIEAKRWGIEAFVGTSKAIKDILNNIRLLQKSDHTSVLIMGESGTGKELVARAIHYGGSRSSRPFVPVNCSAVPVDLAESILFGHLQGSFTGATSNHKGKFELADGGTLFLDEIGDMSSFVQTKLLRVLEDGVIVPIGSTEERRVDVRVIAATNANLDSKIISGRFREDLYHRLAVFTINLPPLRDRKNDIPLLAKHFAGIIATEMGKAEVEISDAAMEALRCHIFTGNARELKNLMERALILSDGNKIEVRHLHFLTLPKVELNMTSGVLAEKAQIVSLPQNLEEAEKTIIKRTINSAGGNISKAARILGVNRTKLYRKLATL